MPYPPKKLAFEEARQKIYRYCSYQERCHKEVKNKLYEMGIRGDQSDELLSELITQGFLNEERFARAFAGGKFRIKKWGRMRIANELEYKGLTSNCIKIGLSEINETEYLRTLEELLIKKASATTGENPYIRNDKVAGYAIQKGYEPDLVWELIKEKML
jgi:regulatory protein